ncbi:flagellar motor protein MotB [Reinekea marinisedimentorum]|uniref:Chemotaxis protein MotB n=1 Tax=Reinekea marinisedimentorum TaxID=230495 RepID=A0A4R3IB07_9GAMM|nr:flagellar motor protein MotB [Reinekea marinisedimentorum]TCS43164.1 chemotaxis protein MotB [Reinekea marinisedimentorum]
MDEEDDCPECVPGLPAWMGTFSDLMALLMCFFVLLLSFSEMDALKFKRLAGSMRNAFGVQSELNFNDVPKGTSIIAQEFSPGTPEPTPLNVIRQDTIADLKDSLEIMCQDTVTMQEEQQGDTGQLTRQIIIPDEVLQQQVQEDAERIAEALAEQIADGMLQIETVNETIVIRVKEQSFGAGTDYVADDFLPVLDIVRDMLVTTPGDIYVEGHTDDVPIATARFRSNWLLSASRALAVAEYLFIAPEMDENRFTIVGHGSSKPIASNETPEGRAQNRRVEIIIKKANPEFEGEVVPPEEQGETVDPGDASLFGLDPQEIF